MLYDRPVADLMVEARGELPERVKPGEIVDWFARSYPKVKGSTVRAHIIGLTANDPSRRHYPSLAQRPPLFIKGPGAWIERFDPDIHLTDDPIDSTVGGDYESPDLIDVEGDDSDAAPSVAGTQEFYLEAYLEEFLVSNWEHLNWGRHLRIWESPTGQRGHQLTTPVGRLDLLCEDLDTGALVVVELKRGRPSDRVVGQTARYMGWVKAHVAEGRAVEGIIVAHDADDRLTYAVAPIPGLSLLVYEINFALRAANVTS